MAYGNAFWLGKKMSEETKRKMSIAKKGKMPKNIYKIAGWNKGMIGLRKNYHHSEETKQKIGIANKLAYSNPILRKECSKRAKEWLKGHKHNWIGKHLSEEHKNKLRNRRHTVITKNKISIKAKERWANKEWVAKNRLAYYHKPNCKEKKLIELLETNYLPYKFVGDLTIIIAGKNPDFINVNGSKKIIELFGDYWHNRKNMPYHQTEIGTKEHYEKFGFKTLVVWEKELKDIPSLLEKIKGFDKL